MQAVVHFEDDPPFPPDEYASELAYQLESCFEEDKCDVPAGQLYLCGVPQIVLTPNEINLARNVNEAAMIKLCHLICPDSWPSQIGLSHEKRLAFLKSRVKLVESRFRPTLADMTEIKRPG
jgi:hypothetical protein